MWEETQTIFQLLEGDMDHKEKRVSYDHVIIHGRHLTCNLVGEEYPF